MPIVSGFWEGSPRCDRSNGPLAQAITRRVKAQQRHEQNRRLDGVPLAGVGMFPMPRTNFICGCHDQNSIGCCFSTTTGRAASAPRARKVRT